MNDDFNSFIRSHGYEPKSEVLAGKWIRFGVKAAISAKLYDDGLGGYLHDWRTGEKFYWFANKENLSNSEYDKRKSEAEDLRRTQEAKRRLHYASAAIEAERLFKEASYAFNTHPYLIKKGVEAYGIKQLHGNLLIPVYSIFGDMQSIQIIDEFGNKKFLKGGKMSGGCHFIGQAVKGKPIYMTEGYATAASVYQDTKSLTVLAFNAANLINVAKELKAATPDIEIVIAGDSDFVGRKYAEMAAKAVNGKTLVPDFGDNPNGYSDWNDYFNHRTAL